MRADAVSPCAALKGSHIEAHPAFARLVRAEEIAQAEAERMVSAIARGDWTTGTPAYKAAGKAMKDMLEAAAEIVAGHGG